MRTFLIGLFVAITATTAAPAIAQQRQENAGDSAVSAAASELTPHWIQDVRTGCKVWDPLPKANESVTWSGACAGGFAAGEGIAEWFENGFWTQTDQGFHINGHLNGQGTENRKNGESYTGQFRNGLFNGFGIYTFTNGAKYSGQFSDGKREGQGDQTFFNGNRYSGNWSNNKPSGHGKMYFTNGNIYEGEFLAGRREGWGTELYSNGLRYVGEWNQDKPFGNGTLIAQDGSSAALFNGQKVPSAGANANSGHCGLASLFAFIGAMGTAQTRSAGVAAAQGLSAGANACD